MTFDEFMANDESKYAVITLLSYLNDPLAKSLTNSPAVVTVNEAELVILSIETDKVAELAAYADQVANGVEFELTLGSGKVTLLTHSQALALVALQA